MPKTDEVHAASEIVVEQLAQTEPEPLPGREIAPAAPRRFNANEKEAKESDKDEKNESAKKKASGAEIQGFTKGIAATDKRVVKGQVTADDGSTLPGVNVIIKGTNSGTVTDESGNYQITVDDKAPTLVFSYLGYSSTEVNAGEQNDVNVKLGEDASQLSEVVVTGYGKNAASDEITSTLELASPVGGKRAFKQYLEKNMQYPQQAIIAGVEGKVTVQFDVESTGMLSDFKILKGIGKGCDEEVIRLIKTGPKWTPTKRDNNSEPSTVRVRMKFQLPKK